MNAGLSVDDRIRETNHRIKNHLQMVASTLTLQSWQSPNPELREELGDAAHRIMAVAFLQDQLQHNGDQPVEMAAYLEDICRDLALTGGCEKRGIGMLVSVEPAVLPSELAITVGLIASELVTNALKHVYRDQPGVIAIRLERDSGDWRLTVADDGPGLADVQPGVGGFGLRLVGRLAQKLGGTLTIVSGGAGAQFRVDFPDPSEAPSAAIPMPAREALRIHASDQARSGLTARTL